MRYIFWCLHSQSWTYYDHVVFGWTILEDGIKKEDNIRMKTNKEFSDHNIFRLKCFYKIFLEAVASLGLVVSLSQSVCLSVSHLLSKLENELYKRKYKWIQ